MGRRSELEPDTLAGPMRADTQGICTMIFSTDDFWCLDMMKKNASRMRVLSVYDLNRSETVAALRHLRRDALAWRFPGVPTEQIEIEDDSVLRRVFDLVGGRMSHLTRVVRADDMIGTRIS